MRTIRIFALIILGITAFFHIPLSLGLCFDTRKGMFRLCLRILFFRFLIFGGKNKLPRLRDFEIHRLKKRGKHKKTADGKKNTKKSIKKEKKKKKSAGNGERFRSLRHALGMVFAVFGGVLTRFGKWVRVDIRYLNLYIGTENPAKTAVLYGSVYAAAETLWAAVGDTRAMRRCKKSAVALWADFETGESAADGKLSFTLFLWQLCDILLAGAFAALKNSGKAEDGKPKEEDNEQAERQKAARAEVLAALRE